MTEQPKVVNIAEIIDKFVGGNKVKHRKAYKLLSDPSDRELNLFYGLPPEDVPLHPAGTLAMVEAESNKAQTLVSACRFDDYGPPIIAMSLKHPGSMRMKSFSLFADEGKGWVPIRFQTQTATA